MANNHRWARGLFVWNLAGSIQTMSGSAYVLITTMRSLFIYGCKLLNNSGAPEHGIRQCYSHSKISNTIMASTVEHKSYVKGVGNYCLINPEVPDTWRDDDRAGDYSLGLHYGYPCFMTTFRRVQFGDAGEFNGTNPMANGTGWNVHTIGGFGPQNTEVGQPKEGSYLCGFEDCWTYEGPPVGGDYDHFHFNCHHGFARGNRYSMGSGSYINGEDGGFGESERVPDGWMGPYHFETANTRPVPSTV
jgi:hypothetical protein